MKPGSIKKGTSCAKIFDTLESAACCGGASGLLLE
jgi:hypothetical protein